MQRERDMFVGLEGKWVCSDTGREGREGKVCMGYKDCDRLVFHHKD